MKERGRTKLTSSVWARALERKDKLATELINEAVEALGAGIASAINLLDVPAVIIGGGLGVRLGEPYVKRIRKAMQPHLFNDQNPPDVLLAGLGDLGGSIGAALLVKPPAARRAPARRPRARRTDRPERLLLAAGRPRGGSRMRCGTRQPAPPRRARAAISRRGGAYVRAPVARSGSFGAFCTPRNRPGRGRGASPRRAAAPRARASDSTYNAARPPAGGNGLCFMLPHAYVPGSRRNREVSGFVHGVDGRPMVASGAALVRSARSAAPPHPGPPPARLTPPKHPHYGASAALSGRMGAPLKRISGSGGR